ncbi:MAG: hypothetical protein AAFQ79_13880, partial [Pseudomonadota bacterium]
DGRISDLVIESYGDVAPSDTPEGPADPAFALIGTRAFDGAARSVLEETPTDDLNIEAGHISFAFNADKVHGMQGLVTRDAFGNENGGHFASYIEKGTLYIRFQDAETEHVFTKSGIKAGEDYEVQAAFGDGKVAAWLDGQSLGEASLDYDWVENDEYLQVGANGWASASGEAGFTNAFDGTISNLIIQAKDPNDAVALDNVVPTFDTPEQYAEFLEEEANNEQAEWFIL